jgi:CubicO group peptidase (beta-lactamase class C family)
VSEIEKAITESLSETRHLGVQVYVSWHGEVVIDTAAGLRDDGNALERDDLIVWFSAGKPLLAAAVCRLWQTGALDLDAPVARYVPEFAVGGKDAVTCRHLLTHSAGRLRASDPDRATALFAMDYEPAVRVALTADMHPEDTPGRQPSYTSSILSWTILSEVVRRLDGRRFDRYVIEEVCGPLGMTCHYGFTEAQLRTLGGRVTTYDRTPRKARYLNVGDAEEGARIRKVLETGSLQRSLDPGAGLWASARDMGRFYEFLCRRVTTPDGANDRGTVLDASSVAAMTRPQRPSFFAETPLVDFGLGVTLEARRHGYEHANFGSYCAQGTFGHQGHGSPMAYADPENGLVVAFNGNGLPGRIVGKRVWLAVSDAIYRELGLASGTPVPAVMPSRERFIDLRTPTRNG